MADIIQKSTEYRIKQIELAEAQYYKSLVATLDRIEREVVSLAGRLPTQDGKLIELQSAIAIRPRIKFILEREYLDWSDTVVREGFNKQAKRVEKAFKKLRISKKFKTLTKSNLALISNLKRQTFTQFKDVSNTFTRKLTEKVYQATLTGADKIAETTPTPPPSDEPLQVNVVHDSFQANSFMAEEGRHMMLGKHADLKAYNHLKEKTVVCSTRVEPPIHPNAGEKILLDFGMWPEEFKEKEFDKYVESQLGETKTTEGIFAPWMMYKNEFIEILGGHDPIMHSCREDSDIFNRMLLADFKFIQPWNSLVYHLTGRGAGSFDGDKERHEQWKKDMSNSTLEFIRKWGTNVNHTPLMKPIVYPVYKKSVIINNSNPQLETILEPWFNGGDGIIVEVDAKTFTQQDFQYIQQLSEILAESVFLEEDMGAQFEVGNLKLTINNIDTYEKDLIICKE